MEEMDDLLYHGTDKNSKDSILQNGINLNQNPRGGDFAVGFYLTPRIESAVAMALRKSYNSNEPGIVELSLKKDFRELVSVRDFGVITENSTNREIMLWAQFVVNNRNGMEYIENVSANQGFHDNNLDKRYDIVVGTIADGNVTQLARKCKSEERTIKLSEAKKLLEKPFGLQYCISTEAGLKMIDKRPSEKKGVLWR